MIDLASLTPSFKGKVLRDQQSLEKYSRDASLFVVQPQAVLWPKDVEDVKAAVRWVAGQKSRQPELSITARSAGTDMSGGPINDSLIMDFCPHFGNITSIHSYGDEPDPFQEILREHGQAAESVWTERLAAHDGYAVAQPGVYYRDFEKAATAKGLLLPCYTASKSLNTLGGMAANNSAGEKSLRYGQTKDYVEGLRAVLSDGQEYEFSELTERQLMDKLKMPNFEGQIYREVYDLLRENYDLLQRAKPSTSKNSAGYLLWEVWDKKKFNMAKLLVGSQGTLGLITSLTLRLVRPLPKSELLVMFLDRTEFLGELIEVVLSHRPESFESFDDHTFRLAMKYLPAMLRQMSLHRPKGAMGFLRLAAQFLPEIRMVLSGGMPKLVLIAEFTGNTEYQARQQLLAAEKEVRQRFGIKTHACRNEAESAKYWTLRRESFNLLRQRVKNLRTAPFIDDLAVHPRDLPEFLPRLNSLLGKYPELVYTVAGHMGDANFHIIPLMDLSRPASRLVIPKLAGEVYDLVAEYRGTITAEHNDGLIRTPFLQRMYGMKVCSLFARVKRIFDPQNIFNPRKKVGGDLDYAMAHLSS